jgi:hypothetical protein
MKTHILKSIAFMLLLFQAVSCNESFFDINKNPNTVVDPTPELTLPVGQVVAANFLQGQYNTSASFWVHYITQAGNIAGQSNIDQYDIPPGDNAHQNQFNNTLYAGALDDLQYTSDRAKADGNDNIFAVAELMKAYMFQVAVDLFDKVPYFQALKGMEFPTPEYDDGDEIYADLLVKIDAALAVIDDNATIEGDLIFDGDMALWRMFGNTLKLKIYLRQSEVNPTLASTGIDALEGEGFLGLGEDAEILYAASPTNNQHPAWENDINAQVFVAASRTIINYMLAKNDPRIDVYYRRPVLPDPANPHKGVPQGEGSTITGTTAGLGYYSARNKFLIQEGSAGVFFSGAESLFLQAEAVARGWMDGDAQDLYENAIRASFIRAGLTEAQANTYITTSSPYPAGTLEQNLTAILTEKWVSFSTRQGIEAFAEWRRTGIPDETVIYVSPISLLPAGEVAVRFPFTAREQGTNPNTPVIESLSTPVWWDID